MRKHGESDSRAIGGAAAGDSSTWLVPGEMELSWFDILRQSRRGGGNQGSVGRERSAGRRERGSTGGQLVRAR